MICVKSWFSIIYSFHSFNCASAMEHFAWLHDGRKKKKRECTNNNNEPFLCWYSVFSKQFYCILYFCTVDCIHGRCFVVTIVYISFCTWNESKVQKNVHDSNVNLKFYFALHIIACTVFAFHFLILWTKKKQKSTKNVNETKKKMKK